MVKKKKEFKDLTEKEKDYIRKRNIAIITTIGIISMVILIGIFLNSCENLIRGFLDIF